MTESEREEMWRIIGKVLESLDRMDERLNKVIEAQREDREKAKEMDERIDKLLETQKEQKERLDRLIESQEKDKERIAELFELHEQTQMELRELKERQEQTEREIIELREAQRESYKNLTKSISDLNGVRINGKDFEIDGFVVGRDFMIVVETKQLENNLKKFLAFYPEYRNYRIYGAIAGIINSDEIK